MCQREDEKSKRPLSKMITVYPVSRVIRTTEHKNSHIPTYRGQLYVLCIISVLPPQSLLVLDAFDAVVMTSFFDAWNKKYDEDDVSLSMNNCWSVDYSFKHTC